MLTNYWSISPLVHNDSLQHNKHWMSVMIFLQIVGREQEYGPCIFDILNHLPTFLKLVYSVWEFH